ncbi:tRNA (5-methylaminomethyl-2-thiouridine)(34)-methyltransferase MnmD [uncultured Litoreibacter sp.]|uniref:tRNA (5-methylaminomethyl-2-thiouridine)(34)-methyltransferase MnmD n=1 Tax=uncultured Litoreibacter sp. TaxID=1392394 RepID=UPI0026315EB8|nr:tRNA (5-methylaminomethyl-2-thiouridine)(34)-methyltransferase MnmD [uncultured Litoreibacter sp.]
MNDQRAELKWRDGGVPVSTRFDDPYFSIDDGLAETRHVFLAGNDLPARFTDGFHIAELGFGTGLNLLTAWQAFLDSRTSGKLHFTSFEAFPMTQADAKTALRAFPTLADLAEPLLEAWSETSFILDTDTLRAEIVIGDARDTVRAMRHDADAWFLDGFSPAKNPELWGDELMQEVGWKTGPGGSFATYTAAGHVRRALEGAGFTVERVPGFGRKRHMSVGRLA